MNVTVYQIAAVIVIVLVAVGLFIFRAKLGEKTFKQLQGIAAISGTIIALAAFCTPPKATCFCESPLVDGTVRCLIAAEAQAANDADLGLVKKIFFANATIFRADTQQTWPDPLLYYQPLFNAFSFNGVTHDPIEKVGLKGETLYYTSGSSGYFTLKGGATTPLNNLNPSEHWVLSKNDQGCWLISRFEFNAADSTPFPP